MINGRNYERINIKAIRDTLFEPNDVIQIKNAFNPSIVFIIGDRILFIYEYNISMAENYLYKDILTFLKNNKWQDYKMLFMKIQNEEKPYVFITKLKEK